MYRHTCVNWVPHFSNTFWGKVPCFLKKNNEGDVQNEFFLLKKCVFCKMEWYSQEKLCHLSAMLVFLPYSQLSQLR